MPKIPLPPLCDLQGFEISSGDNYFDEHGNAVTKEKAFIVEKKIYHFRTGKPLYHRKTDEPYCLIPAEVKLHKDTLFKLTEVMRGTAVLTISLSNSKTSDPIPVSLLSLAMLQYVKLKERTENKSATDQLETFINFSSKLLDEIPGCSVEERKQIARGALQVAMTYSVLGSFRRTLGEYLSLSPEEAELLVLREENVYRSFEWFVDSPQAEIRLASIDSPRPPSAPGAATGGGGRTDFYVDPAAAVTPPPPSALPKLPIGPPPAESASSSELSVRAVAPLLTQEEAIQKLEECCYDDLIAMCQDDRFKAADYEDFFLEYLKELNANMRDMTLPHIVHYFVDAKKPLEMFKLAKLHDLLEVQNFLMREFPGQARAMMKVLQPKLRPVNPIVGSPIEPASSTQNPSSEEKQTSLVTPAASFSLLELDSLFETIENKNFENLKKFVNLKEFRDFLIPTDIDIKYLKGVILSYFELLKKTYDGIEDHRSTLMKVINKFPPEKIIEFFRNEYDKQYPSAPHQPYIKERENEELSAYWKVKTGQTLSSPEKANFFKYRVRVTIDSYLKEVKYAHGKTTNQWITDVGIQRALTLGNDLLNPNLTHQERVQRLARFLRLGYFNESEESVSTELRQRLLNAFNINGTPGFRENINQWVAKKTASPDLEATFTKAVEATSGASGAGGGAAGASRSSPFAELETLIANPNVNINNANGKGAPLLYLIITNPLLTDTDRDSLVTKVLTRKDVSLNYKDSTGKSLLDLAKEKEQTSVVEKLADIFAKKLNERCCKLNYTLGRYPITKEEILAYFEKGKLTSDQEEKKLDFQLKIAFKSYFETHPYNYGTQRAEQLITKLFFMAHNIRPLDFPQKITEVLHFLQTGMLTNASCFESFFKSKSSKENSLVSILSRTLGILPGAINTWEETMIRKAGTPSPASSNISLPQEGASEDTCVFAHFTEKEITDFIHIYQKQYPENGYSRNNDSVNNFSDSIYDDSFKDSYQSCVLDRETINHVKTILECRIVNLERLGFHANSDKLETARKLLKKFNEALPSESPPSRRSPAH